METHFGETDAKGVVPQGDDILLSMWNGKTWHVMIISLSNQWLLIV